MEKGEKKCHEQTNSFSISSFMLVILLRFFICIYVVIWFRSAPVKITLKNAPARRIDPHAEHQAKIRARADQGPSIYTYIQYAFNNIKSHLFPKV